MASLRRTFIKDIIDRNQLSVVFQPIVSLRTGSFTALRPCLGL